MKNKILKLSKGDFQSLKAEIEFDETNLVLVIGEGDVHKSSFSIKTESNRLIRGLLYTTSERMKFKNQGFEGNPATIEFVYDGRGLAPGHVEKGTITVVSDAGEYDLSFTAIIERPFVMTNYGKVQSTEDFRKLAVKDYDEALKLFRSRTFYDILKYENDRIFYLYDNMRKWELNEQAMEEFLLGIKQKERIFLTLSDQNIVYTDLSEAKTDQIQILKNTWGFMQVRVETDGAFISVKNSEFNTNDFTGNSYELEYEIDHLKLHNGRNFGDIRLITPYETLSYSIEVIKTCDTSEQHKIIANKKVQLFKDYIEYVSGRMDAGNWLKSAIEKMNALCKMDPKNDFYQLIRANIFLIGQKKDEAKNALDNFNFGRFVGIRNPINNAYFSFLNAWLKGSTMQMERALDDIYKALSTNPDSWILLSMALTMDARLKSPYRKIELLEEYFEYGSREVLFYHEVYKCYKEKPSLLRAFGKLEKEVLNFASKYQLISKEMALHIAMITNQQKSFDPMIYKVLSRIYSQYEEPAILNSICTFLIKGNKIGPEYFTWYKKAVEQDLKIAQLYEYYMYSIDEYKFRELLPKKIIYYFMHGNNLDYKKKAVLYANIVLNEDLVKDYYQGYEKQMIEFTWEQVLKRHITDALRILYKRFCCEEDMTDERIEAIRDICYSYSIHVKSDSLNRVIVIENNGEIGQKVRYNAKTGAVIRLYSNDSRIVWESMDGHYYTDSIVYETKRLFYEPKFIEICERYEKNLLASDQEEKKIPSIEGIREYGLKAFSENEVLEFCKDKIIEIEYKEDAFLLSLSFMLFDHGYYNHETLAYLAEYYCGPTVNMKRIWYVLDEKNLSKLKLSESIISQAVFTEHIVNDEKIFEDYYHSESVFEQLKQAYLAYVSREYVLYDKDLLPSVFEILITEFKNQEELADICKIAVLKYYAENEYSTDFSSVLHDLMCELCEKKLIFPFFKNYDAEWLKEFMLYDKSMIFYKATAGNRVNLFYKLECEEGEGTGYHSEIMVPVFENIYLKQFVLYKNESIKYYIQEFSNKGSRSSEKMILSANKLAYSCGKFGRINSLTDKEDDLKTEGMLDFAIEELLSEEIFKTY